MGHSTKEAHLVRIGRVLLTFCLEIKGIYYEKIYFSNNINLFRVLI